MEINMKKTLLTLMLCIGGLMYAQDDSSSYDEDWTFTYRVFPNKYEYVSVDELQMIEDKHTSRRIIYKPFMDISILDTLNKIRVSKGLSPVLYDTTKISDELFDDQIYFSQDYAKKYNQSIYLLRDEDPDLDCDCVRSIVEDLLDDSLIFVRTNFFTKKEKIELFRDILMDKRLKKLKVYYFQSSYKNANWAFLYVYSKKKGRIFSSYHYLIDEERMTK